MINTYLKEVEINGVKTYKTYTKIGNVRPDPLNPRDISDEKLNDLKDYISKYGELKPVLLDIRPEKEGQLIGGNQRLKAYKELGKTEIWIEPTDPMTDAQAFEMGTIDNMLFGQYVEDKLELLLKKYQDELDFTKLSVNLETSPSFAELLKQFNSNTGVTEDEAPPVSSEPAVSKLGEVYQLGRHRLMCGDATKIEDVEKLMGGVKADMVFTDPPYGMFLDADFSDMKNNLDFAKDKGFIGGRKYDNVIGDHADFNPDFINTIFTVFPETKEVFMWGANYYTELLQNRNDGSWFVWDKRLDESADKMYGSGFELVWSKAKHKQDIVRIKWAGVFGTEQEFDHKRHHPTQKPVALSAWFIEKYSQPEQKIIDLFGGSGSTLIACEQTNRTCYMMELDPKYCDVIRKRYAKFIGKEDWQEVTSATSYVQETNQDNQNPAIQA